MPERRGRPWTKGIPEPEYYEGGIAEDAAAIPGMSTQSQERRGMLRTKTRDLTLATALLCRIPRMQARMRLVRRAVRW